MYKSKKNVNNFKKKITESNIILTSAGVHLLGEHKPKLQAAIWWEQFKVGTVILVSWYWSCNSSLMCVVFIFDKSNCVKLYLKPCSGFLRQFQYFPVSPKYFPEEKIT